MCIYLVNMPVYIYAHICYHRTMERVQKQRIRPLGVIKGSEEMTAPNTSELLVEQAQIAERLRLLMLAEKCKSIEEFRDRLRDLIEK